jgi:tripartite-type tricarboxylate transporter receptor subunit TctC
MTSRSPISLAVAVLVVAGPAAFAEPYPTGPVRVVVPFPPGGGVDSAGRILTSRLTETMGKSFFVENRGGANGNIGTEIVSKAPRDGYTLLFTGAGFVTNPSLYRKPGYEPTDFEPVSLMALGPNVLVVHPSLPVKSVKDLIALARAKPGEIGFAGSGSGSTPHLAGELFNTLAHVKMVHVPYRGSGPAIVGLLSGETPVMFLPAINAGQHVKTGRLRGIAVTSKVRLHALPQLPTIHEAGIPGYESAQWYGVLSPAGTPEEILNALNAQIAAIMRTPEMKKRMDDDGLLSIGSSRQEFAAHIRTEIAKWAKVIKQSGAHVD